MVTQRFVSFTTAASLTNILTESALLLPLLTAYTHALFTRTGVLLRDLQ
jgi:hypothetical protein